MTMIDIFSVWALPDGTPDNVSVPYSELAFIEALVAANSQDMDNHILVTKEELLKLRKEWADEFGEVIDCWLILMDAKGQDFIRLVINY
jgi:hypothetical protein